MDKLSRLQNIWGMTQKWLGKHFAHLLLVCCGLLGIGCSPRLEEYQHGTVRKPVVFGIRNLTTIEIVPGKSEVNVEWKGFDTLTGNALRVGHEEILVSDQLKTFLVTDKDCGNNRLCVNGVKYSFDAQSQHLLIDLTDGIKVASGANYAGSKHVYDKNVFPSN